MNPPIKSRKHGDQKTDRLFSNNTQPPCAEFTRLQDDGDVSGAGPMEDESAKERDRNLRSALRRLLEDTSNSRRDEASCRTKETSGAGGLEPATLQLLYR